MSQAFVKSWCHSNRWPLRHGECETRIPAIMRLFARFDMVTNERGSGRGDSTPQVEYQSSTASARAARLYRGQTADNTVPRLIVQRAVAVGRCERLGETGYSRIQPRRLSSVDARTSLKSIKRCADRKTAL